MSFIVTGLCLFALTSSYNIDWSSPYTYCDGGALNSYLINLVGTDPGFLLICFEEMGGDNFSGICETLKLDIPNDVTSVATKNMFQEKNASNRLITHFNQF